MKNPATDRRASPVFLFGAFVLLGIMTVFLETNSWSVKLLGPLRSASLPTAMLDNGETGKIMKTLGLVYLEDNDQSRYRHSGPDSGGDNSVAMAEREAEAGDRWFFPNLFQKKRHVGDKLYHARPGGKARFPSMLEDLSAVEKAQQKLVSIATETIADGTGPVDNVNQVDEIAATMTVYHSGKPVMINNVFLRPDKTSATGNNMRLVKSGFNAVFRGRTTIEPVTDGHFFDSESTLPRDRVRLGGADAMRQEVSLMLAKMAKLHLPAFDTALFYVNGKASGTRVLLDTVDVTKWTKAVGTPIDFFHSDTRIDETGWSNYQEMAGWFSKFANSLNMDLAGQAFDVENLTRNMVVNMYCGASNWDQWAAFRRQKPHARWKWIVWDLGTCISDRWNTSNTGLAQQHWLQVAITKDQSTGLWRETHRDLRTLLFATLLNNDPRYRRYFAETMRQFIDSELDLQLLEQRIRYHEKFTVAESSPTAAEIRQFLQQRGNFIKSELDQLQASGAL